MSDIMKEELNETTEGLFNKPEVNNSKEEDKTEEVSGFVSVRFGDCYKTNKDNYRKEFASKKDLKAYINKCNCPKDNRCTRTCDVYLNTKDYKETLKEKELEEYKKNNKNKEDDIYRELKKV